jgi:hypothetical protein
MPYNSFDILRLPITITPKGPGVLVRGIFTYDDGEPYEILASVQPISGEVVDSMGVGRRGIGKVKIFTQTELNVTGTDNGVLGDYVSWKGNNYEIIAKEKDQNRLINLNGPTNHYKYVAELREQK